MELRKNHSKVLSKRKDVLEYLLLTKKKGGQVDNVSKEIRSWMNASQMLTWVRIASLDSKFTILIIMTAMKSILSVHSESLPLEMTWIKEI